MSQPFSDQELAAWDQSRGRLSEPTYLICGQGDHRYGTSDPYHKYDAMGCVNMLLPALDAATAEITRLRTALEAVYFPHDAKTLYQDSLHAGEWICDECGEPGEDCPTQTIVLAALDTTEVTT